MANRKTLQKLRQSTMAGSTLLAVFVLLAGGMAAAQTAAAPQVNSHAIPVVDGDIGSCSVVFTITDSKGAPLYNAKVKVHIAYGFLGAHKLDLEVGTNIDGKARFTGLPSKVKLALHFLASKGDLEGSAFYDPNHNCTAKHDIVLLKQPSESQP